MHLSVCPSVSQSGSQSVSVSKLVSHPSVSLSVVNGSIVLAVTVAHSIVIIVIVIGMICAYISQL